MKYGHHISFLNGETALRNVTNRNFLHAENLTLSNTLIGTPCRQMDSKTENITFVHGR